ncbi:MAG: LytTR family transcriptional regulator [Chitinophagaceae bacterium]|nr:MAG: LytTR family transcriptional regulator [Chitinophagaceae bacterium]
MAVLGNRVPKPSWLTWMAPPAVLPGCAVQEGAPVSERAAANKEKMRIAFMVRVKGPGLQVPARKLGNRLHLTSNNPKNGSGNACSSPVTSNAKLQTANLLLHGSCSRIAHSSARIRTTGAAAGWCWGFFPSCTPKPNAHLPKKSTMPHPERIKVLIIGNETAAKALLAQLLQQPAYPLKEIYQGTDDDPGLIERLKPDWIFYTDMPAEAALAVAAAPLSVYAQPVTAKPLAPLVAGHALSPSGEMGSLPSFSPLFHRAPVYKHRFLIRINERLIPLDVSEIAYFFVENNISFLRTFEGKRYIVEFSITELVQVLDPAQFFRINRAQLVSFRSLAGITQHYSNRLRLALNPPVKEDVFVSREKVAGFKKWIGG